MAQDWAESEARYRELMERYEERKKKYSKLTEQIDKAQAADKTIGHFIDLLRKKKKPVTEFDENLWGGMAQGMTINPDGKVTVIFKGGYEVKISM